MSIFNQMIRGSGGLGEYSPEITMKNMQNYKPRTFKETIKDQIAAHEAKVTELRAVYDSLTPEIEKFVEALQKLG